MIKEKKIWNKKTWRERVNKQGLLWWLTLVKCLSASSIIILIALFDFSLLFFVLSLLSHMNSMPCNYFCYCLDVWWKNIHGCMRMGSQHVLPVVSMWGGFAFYWIKCQTFFFSLSGVCTCCFGEGYRSIPLRYGLCGYLNDLLVPVKKSELCIECFLSSFF